MGNTIGEKYFAGRLHDRLRRADRAELAEASPQPPQPEGVRGAGESYQDEKRCEGLAHGRKMKATFLLPETLK